MSYKVLIMDGYIRNSIALLRSLGTKGVTCDIAVGLHSNRWYARVEKMLRSRFAQQVFEISEKTDDARADRIEEILKSGNYDAVLAGGTYYSNLLSKYKERFSVHTQVLSESNDKMQLVHNKDSCMEFASKLGIRTPGTFRARSLDELKEIAKATRGQVIVKFNDSYASRGLKKYSGGEEDFISSYAADYGFDFEGDNFPLIQQLIDGDLIDSTSFSIDGDCKAVLTQKREMTAWLDGGGGVVNITVDEAEVKEGARTLLDALKWTGHLEMDWIKEESTGHAYLIEINPKFWGTTQLTIDAGFDFPYWYLMYAVGKECDYPANHKVGLRFRWLMYEVETIMTQPKSVGRFFTEVWLSFQRNFKSNTRSNFYKDDPLPSVKNVIDGVILILKTWTIGK